jgi:hypothetical protein
MIPMGTHICSSSATAIPSVAQVMTPISKTAPINDRLRIRFPLLNSYLRSWILKNAADINPNEFFFNE